MMDTLFNRFLVAFTVGVLLYVFLIAEDAQAGHDNNLVPTTPLFAVGDRVKVSSYSLNVWESPHDLVNIAGAQSENIEGVVVDEPFVAPNGKIWYLIDYDSGPDGWSGEYNLGAVE